jgi:hypothetical protein
MVGVISFFMEMIVMMFMLNTTISLQVLALVAAAFLLSWGLYKQGSGTGVAKFFGFVTTIIALISLVSTLYFTARIWQEGRMMRDGMHPMAAGAMQNTGDQGATATAEKPAPAKKR